MERVKNIGGIFFQAKDPDGLREWYRKYLGVKVTPWGGAQFPWKPIAGKKPSAVTAWMIYAAGSDYFGPGSHVINYQVQNLDRMLAQLRSAGGFVADQIDEDKFGRFAFAADPEGNRFQLWEPLAVKKPAGAKPARGKTKPNQKSKAAVKRKPVKRR